MKRTLPILAATVLSAGLTSAACTVTSDPNPQDLTTSATSSSSGAGGATSASSTTASSTSGSTGGGGGAFMTAKHRAWPTLENLGGATMTAPRLVLILPQNEAPAAATEFQKFADALPTSAWYAAWAPEYAAGVARPSTTIPGPPVVPGTITNKTTGAAYVASALASADPSLAPDGNTFYFLFIPDGAYPLGGDYIEGHHWAYGANGDGFGITERGPKDTNDLQVLEIIAAHEFAEGVSDSGMGWKSAVPAGKNPWDYPPWNAWEGLNQFGGYIENGDYCTGMQTFEGGVGYQPIWTNKAAALGGNPCVPDGSTPYFNVSTDKDWYPGAAGGAVTIPITGWSTAATEDFWIAVDAASWGSNTQTYSPTIDTPRTGMLQGSPWTLINNGEAATISVPMPANAGSGSWVTLSIWTWHADANNITPAGEDQSHLFVVGAYVP